MIFPILIVILLQCILVKAQLQSRGNSEANSDQTIIQYIRYKDHTNTLPRNGKRIGSINDESMRNFRPISSHGREDVFSDGGDDNNNNDGISTIYYQLKLILRAIIHLINFSPVILTCIFAMISSSFRKYIWYDLIRYGLGRGGAAFIKWGQWSSTRPDMFPEELCNALAKLQASAPEHSFSYTKKAIKEELGESIEDIFDYFSPRPLASGSIAQVYRAILRGKEVAVKVRHPNVYEQIKLDFTIMKVLANFLDKIPGLSWLNLPESTNQFSGTIASQTKLDIEGRHLILFNRYFKSWKRARFPQPVMFTDGILIESFEHGETVAEFAKRVAQDYSKGVSMSNRDIELAHFIVTIGEDIYLKMLIQDNLMHADLHPGNILIQHSLDGIPMSRSDFLKVMRDECNDNSSSSSSSSNNNNNNNTSYHRMKTEIVLVDAGMVACLTLEERSNFIGLLEAVGDGNGYDAANYIMKFSNKYRRYTKSTIENFQKDASLLFSKICRGYGTNVDMGEVLRGILNLVRIHHITIDANYATLFLNVLCLDGLAKSILPAYNVLDGAMNLLKLHKLSRRIPGAHNLIVKLGLPYARWLKRKFDQSFLINFFKEKVKR